jgi:hypothetical protein
MGRIVKDIDIWLAYQPRQELNRSSTASALSPRYVQQENPNKTIWFRRHRQGSAKSKRDRSAIAAFSRRS